MIELAPGDYWGYLGLARVKSRTGRAAEAVPLYEKAYAMAPADPAVVSGLVSAYFAVPPRQADGLKLLDERLATKPDARVKGVLVSLIFNHGAYDKIGLVDRLLKYYPDDPNGPMVVVLRFREQAKKDPVAARAKAGEMAKSADAMLRVGAYDFLIEEAVHEGRAALDALVRETEKSGEALLEPRLRGGRVRRAAPYGPRAAARRARREVNPGREVS